MADMLIQEGGATRWRDRVREDAHPLLGTTATTVALVVVGLVSMFVPVVGVLAIAVVAAFLIHAAITAAVRR
jgi:hypothetical protein